MKKIRRLLREGIHNLGINIEKIRDPFADQGILLGGKADLIFDVGANQGGTAINYSRVFPKASICSFEPSPQLFGELSENVSSLNVKPVKMAISESEGDNTFYEYDISGYNSFSKSTDDRVKIIRESNVPTTTIDAYCSQNNISRIDILKLDIQGSELRALRGATKNLANQSISLIYSEVIFDVQYQEQCFYHDVASMLATFGYQMFRFYDLRHDPFRRTSYCDAIFVSKNIDPRIYS